MTYRVTGTGLLSLVADCPGYQPSRLVGMAGYIKPNGKLAYCDFYEELIKAKNGGTICSPTYDDTDYEQDCSPEDRLWCQCIAEVLPNVDEEDAKEWVAKELDDLGIETEEQLREAFYGCYDPWNMYEEIGQESVENMGERIPEYLEGCINWERLWDSYLRYDFNTFDFAGNTYVFRNCY